MATAVNVTQPLRVARHTIRFGVVLCLLILALIAATVCGVTLGPVMIAPGHSVGVLLGGLGVHVGLPYTSTEAQIILGLRLPRVLTAGLVGAGLASAGLALQGLFRNPLADPGITGVSSGGAFGAVLALASGFAARIIWVVPALAFAFALVTALGVYALAIERGRVQVASLLLAGVAVSSLMNAGITAVLTLTRDAERLREILFWLLGGFINRTWGHVLTVAPFVALGIAVLLAFARDLNVLLLGEEEASALGLDVPRLRLIVLVVTALITGAAVAVSGVIGFVGLIVPHAARLVLGPDHRALLPASALGGAAFLIAADTVARLVLQPGELPVGVLTALLGAPFFLGLLVANRRHALAFNA